MTSFASLSVLPLSRLASRCAQETERFFRREDHDPEPCYELFRRALQARDDAAYAALYHQYQPMVRRWVQQHPAFSGDEEADLFVNSAFEKLWQAVTPEKFHRFPNLKSLLAYLKLCVHSVLIDHVRSRQLAIADQEPQHVLLSDLRPEADPLRMAIAQVERGDLWRLIRSKLQDERERTVIYGCFVLSLKPRELYAQRPDLFGDVQEVYRTKQNVLERLRRDKDLRAFLE